MARPPKDKKPITVVERRLKSGSVFGTSSKPVPLVEADRWTVRFVNSQISDSHLYDMQAEKGWVYAAPEDIACEPHEMGLRIMDGRVVRGLQGQEVLMKMEKKDYKAVQQAKEQANRAQTFGKKAVKASVLAAASAEKGGDEGAEFLNRAMNNVTVTDSLERVSLDD